MSSWRTTPSSATSALTSCHDVLATIFDRLAPERVDPDDPDREAELLRWCCRKTLVASALSCSVLSHHALNVLWRELDDIHPLLKVLPNYKRVDSRFVLCGAILPEHWTRLQFYADRVRVILGAPSQPEDAIQPSVWMFLATLCKGSPLTPRLRELLSYNVPVPESSNLILLISPTLRIIDVSFELVEDEYSAVATHVVGSLLHTLPLLAPDLEDLTFDVDVSAIRGPITLGHGYLESFGHHFRRLKTLSIRCGIPLDKNVLQLLSSIPTLKDLSFTIDSDNSPTLVSTPRCKFWQLTDLHVAGYLDHVVAFCHASQLPSLVCMTLRITGPPVARGLKDSFAAICQSYNPLLLTSVSLQILHPFSGHVPRPSSLMQYCESLFQFPNITSFHFHCVYVVPPIHDDDLARCGAAWPQLESFRVSHFLGKYSLPNVARPTLFGLIELAQRCPRLDMFHIPELDVSTIPDKDAVPCTAHSARHFTIKTVMPNNALPSPPTIYMEVGTVLDRAFPDIDLEYARSGCAFDGEGWKDILRLLEAMRVGRENSELRARLRRG